MSVSVIDATSTGSTGTVMVSGNMPAFSYYSSAGTTLASSSFTKIVFDSKDFDTNNCVSNSRFTPTVAGYYQITAQIYWGAASRGTETIIYFYKNGSGYKSGTDTAGSTSFYLSQATVLVYMNGTTDYLEIYGYAGTGALTGAGQPYQYFQGVMVRGA